MTTTSDTDQTPAEYAADKTRTIEVLLRGLERTNSLGAPLDPAEGFHHQDDDDLYAALAPEVSVAEGDPITEEDIREALDGLPVGIDHPRVFHILLSTQGPVAYRLRVEGSGPLGTPDFTIDQVHQVTFDGQSEPDTVLVAEDDARWEFAEYTLGHQFNVFGL